MLLKNLGHVEAHTAKQDKIEATIGEWVVTGSDSDIEIFFRGIVEQLGPTGEPWFQRNRFQEYRGYKFNIRGTGYGGHERLGVPLFSGTLSARRMEAPDDLGPSVWRVSVLLSLNTTRYLRHQSVPRPISENADEWPEPTLLTRRASRHTPGERVLDESDNIIPDAGPTRTWSAPRYWPVHLERYLRAVFTLMNDLVSAARIDGQPHVRFEPRFNLRKVETYWEFFSDDALRAVAAIEEPILQTGVEANTREYEHGYAETRWNGNALAVSANIVTGTKLMVYAKTSKRVRFEVRHNLMEQVPPSIGSSHTTDNFSQFTDWIEELAEVAVARLNPVIDAIVRDTLRVEDHASVHEFLSKLFRVCPDSTVFDTILNILVRTQGIRLHRGSDLREPVNRLFRTGVLVRARPRVSSFVVAPRYRRAVLTLRGVGRRFPDHLH